MSDIKNTLNKCEEILLKNVVIIPDFPEVGIRYLEFYRTFDDKPDVRSAVVASFVEKYKKERIDVVAAIGGGGFTLGGCVAHELGLRLVPIRKAGDTVYNAYTSEIGMVYATRRLSLSKDVDLKNKRVLLIDDTIASGGTFSGAIDVLEQAGAIIHEIATVFETTSKGGRNRVAPHKVFSLIAREAF